MFELPSPLFKQNLSPEAAAAKAERDLRYAKTPARRAKKADSQRRRRKAEKEGRNIAGMDFDHKDGEFKDVAANRGNDGQGTKKEGGKRYKIG